MATKKTVAAQSAARNAAKLPADLPTNWTDGQIVAPNGEEVGLTPQHGYNYLMRQVNAAQQGVNDLAEAAESSDAVKYTAQDLSDAQKMQARGNIGAMPWYPVSSVADCNGVSVPGTYRIMETSKNCPISAPYTGDVLMVMQWDQGTAYQVYFHGTNPTEFYVRGSAIGTVSSWNPWQRLASAAELNTGLSGRVLQLGVIPVTTNAEIDSKINALYNMMPNNTTAFAELRVDVGGLALGGGTWMLQLNRADAAYGFVFVSKYGFATEFGYYRSWYNSAWGPWQTVPLKSYVDAALANKADTAAVNAALANKADISALNAKITGGTTDIGVGAALASGTLYVVYE